MSESSATLSSSASTPEPVPEDWTPGRIGYEAYGDHPGAHGPWTTFDGRPMPTWSDLKKGGPAGQLTRDRWEIAARTIISE
ncbi:hypothetical protein D187_008722 [Cystobacter fuscus DSM 2262]|uniref:Uncharacterized protein n=1 Tax=Cystobacter fuscus (strain ATCC 25194 / DSM 2262 / NBRC 100088 / M29) TaxID=1242864 RepID=S9QMP4_CYSF2|nr:hypothetical protein [Cystobacter fuscus]EPX62534.1 hypothetical protein D187_008722 [Cystobacter fuscus DSM 2262]